MEISDYINLLILQYGFGLYRVYIESLYRGLTENDSQYYRLSLFRTQNEVPKVSAIMKIDYRNWWVSNWVSALSLSLSDSLSDRVCQL